MVSADTPSNPPDGDVHIRPLASDQLREAAAVHEAAFPEFFLASLGQAFLREFYRASLLNSDCITLVAVDGDRVIGIVTGTMQPAGYFTSLLRANPVRLAVAAATSCARKPSNVRALLGRLSSSDSTPDGADVLLSSICVDPRTRSRGAGARLLTAFLEQADARQGTQCFLTTDADGNDQVNAWYRSRGWSTDHTVTGYGGRRMRIYTHALGRRTD